MLENLLIGLAGFPPPERLISWGRLLGRSGRVSLACAVESNRAMESAQEHVSGIARSFLPAAQTVVRMGTLEGLLLQYTSEIVADLLVVGGGREYARTVEFLLSHSEIPVLVVPPSMDVGEASLRRIIVPLDGSALSEMVLPIVRNLGRDHGSTVVLTRIMTRAEILHRNYSRIDANLIKLASALVEIGVDCKVATRSGGAPEGIAQVADEEKADLILMATHGNRGWKRSILGTVTGKVVRASRVPVLSARIHALKKVADPISRDTAH